MIDQLVKLAWHAGEAILSVYHDPHYDDNDWTAKNDGSPLTRADLSAHQCISDGLKQFDTVYPILSEESDTSAAYEIRRHWKRYWLVDPLDGTKEFIKRNGEFTVNIALIESGVPIMGVVHAPALNITYYGSHQQGAFKQQADDPPVLLSSLSPTQDITAVVSKSHLTQATSEFLEKLQVRQRQSIKTVSVGSSLKLCYVAEGAASVYPRLGPTMEWDTAAADAVVRAAGGFVLAISSLQPLQYNKPDLLNPHFVVTSSSLLESTQAVLA